MESLFCLHHADEGDAMFVCPLCGNGREAEADLMRALASEQGVALDLERPQPVRSAWDELDDAYDQA